MLHRFLWIFILSIIAPLFAEEDIVVRLASKNALSSLYLHFIPSNESGFDPSYLQKIEEVLGFDLNNNGKTERVPKNKSLSETEEMQSFLAAQWQKLGVDYVVKVSIKAKKLNLAVFTTKTGQIKGLEGIPLTGSLAQDRRQMHRAADKIHEALFGTPGIADTRILFTVRTKKGDDSSSWVTEVWESDYDGANARQLTKEQGLCVTPAYLPAEGKGRCQQFLYVSYKIGQPKIIAATTVSEKTHRLSYLRGNQLMPAIAPQKNKIAFISDITGNPDLFIQDFSPEAGLIGKPRQVFAAPQSVQGTPSFSPDGKQLAFVSNKDGTPRIYIMDIPHPGAALKDIKLKLVSKKCRENTSPAWSPDGSKIAFSASASGTRQLWIYDIASGEETQLTEGSGHKENPTWAPNSLHLLFNSSTLNASELYMINLNQKKAVKINTILGEKRFPAWEALHFQVLR